MEFPVQAEYKREGADGPRPEVSEADPEVQAAAAGALAQLGPQQPHLRDLGEEHLLGSWKWLHGCAPLV